MFPFILSTEAGLFFLYIYIIHIYIYRERERERERESPLFRRQQTLYHTLASIATFGEGTGKYFVGLLCMVYNPTRPRTQIMGL